MTSPCQDNGSMSVELLGGGTPPYEVVLRNFDTGEELGRIINQGVGTTVLFNGLSGTPAGINYGVSLVDSIGCVSNETFIPITSPPNPDLTFPAANQQMTVPTCVGGDDGSLIVSASGGTSPYDYRWIEYPEYNLRTGFARRRYPSRYPIR